MPRLTSKLSIRLSAPARAALQAVRRRAYRSGHVGSCALPVLLAIMGTALVACDTGTAPSLWDPDNAVPGPAPTIDSVEPPEVALSGVDLITIRGQNFSAIPDMNVVTFDATRVPVIQASTTELVVQAPNEPNPAVTLRVATIGSGAEDFSNPYQLQLLPAAEPYGDILPVEQPFAIATDAAGNLFVSVFRSGVSAGIRKIPVEGESTQFSATTFKWDGLAVGPDGFLYAVRNVRAVFRFPPEGGNQETWAVESNPSVTFNDIDFDDRGNVWAVGNNQNLYRIAPDKSITAFPFTANVRAVKVAGSDLFALVAAAAGGEVWRFQLNASGDVDAGELYASLAASTTATVFSIEAATNGDLFVGTSGRPPIWVVKSDRSVEPLYPGVLTKNAISLAWGEDPFLLMSEGLTGTQTGPVIQKINTRRSGIR